MPWTRQLASGKFQGLYRDANGKEQSAGTYTHEAEAKREAGAREKEQRGPLALDIEGAKIQWGAWFELWHSSRMLAYSTDSLYQSIAANHVLPEWEHKRLMDIKTLPVQQWVTRMWKARKSPYTIRAALMLFKSSLNAAVHHGRLPASPAKKVPYPDLPQASERYLTPDEVEALAFQMDGFNATVLWTAVETGMRFGEISGLHWNRVDFERRVIRVADQYDQKACVIKPGPKDKEARTVPMTPDLVSLLANLKSVTSSARRKVCGIPHEAGHCGGDLVFRGARQAPITSKEWGRGVFAKALLRAEIEGRVRPHDLRHTYASWCLQQGVHLAELAEVMGHSKIEVTMKYAHLSSQSIDTVRDALTAHRRTAARTADPGFAALHDVSSHSDEQAV